MSWEIVNQILGLAAIDGPFAQELLRNPLAAVQARGFRLTAEEQEIFRTLSEKNLRDLSQRLIKELKHE